MYINKQT